MKKIYLLVLSMFVTLASYAQTPDYSMKFGKVTDYELKMERYEADTSADAVIIYEDTHFMYIYTPSVGFQQIRYYEVKLKVLNQQGASNGDIAINYYDGSGLKESVSKIVAASYNLENGKVVKKELNRKDIYHETVSENQHLLKFSIPEVKAGSVIEFKYMIQSNIIYMLPVIKLQRSIPVIYRSAKVEIPEYMHFGMHTKGYQNIQTERETKESKIRLGGSISGNNDIQYTTEVYKFTTENVPALRDEEYVWHKDDFTTSVEFELKQTRFPDEAYKSFSNTWHSVNAILDENAHFLAGMRIGNLFKDEVKDIMGRDNSVRERLAAIHRMVMSRIAWDGRWRLMSHNIKDAVKSGSGCSSDINFALRGALIDAGYNVELILLNPRRYGRLPYSSPSISNINTFILMVTLPDGELVFLDGTDRNSGVNMLPESLLVDRARIYGVDDEKGWVDLTNISNHSMTTHIACKLDENGMLTGRIINQYQYAPAFNLKRSYRAERSKADYVEMLEEKMNIAIEDYEILDLSSHAVAEQYTFTMQCNATGDKIYVKPTVIRFMDKNLFSVEHRKLPIEFSYPYTHTVTVRIELPDGYKLEEVPSPVSYVGGSNDLKYVFHTETDEKVFSSLATFECSTIIYPNTVFKDLYAFFGAIADANQRMVVLTKDN